MLCLWNGVVCQARFVLLQVGHSLKCSKGIIEVTDHIHALFAATLVIR